MIFGRVSKCADRAMFVDFVDAIRNAGEDALPETVSLREVVFTYSRGKQANTLQQLPPWRVRLDLAANEGVTVKLEKGNPHLRVLNCITNIARSAHFDTLPKIMLLTLPLYRGLDKMEDEWSSITLLNPNYSVLDIEGQLAADSRRAGE